MTWGFKDGKLGICKIGGLAAEQEGTELLKTALAMHQLGLERIAWTPSQLNIYQAPEDLNMHVICIAVECKYCIWILPKAIRDPLIKRTC